MSSAGDVVVGDVQKLLDSVLSEILEVDSQLSKAVYFLPKYDLKQSREVIQNLRNKVCGTCHCCGGSSWYLLCSENSI